MFDNDNNNFNAITLGTNNSKSRKQKIYCVICFPKLQLELVNAEEFRYKCPRCKNFYQILDNNEGDMIPEIDELVSSHDENEGPALVTADYTIKPEQVLNVKKSDIKIPKYMQNTDTTTVIDYQES
jgi:phage FluMu protein Com